MIAQLRGKVCSKAPNLVVVEVGGVGYQIFIPLSTFYRLPEPGQEVLLLTRTLLRDESISLYGFKADDTPNISQAIPLEPVPPLIDFHFTAFTNNQAESRQILNPWTQNPLAEWAQRHPLQQLQSAGSFSQLVVLFSPNGVYVATLGVLQPDQVAELTDLGVEMVRTQGVVHTQ